VHALDAGAHVVSVACPKLVPLIEAGVVGEELDAAVREYAAPLKEEGVDTVILGCTHYPMIRRVFERAFGRGTTLVFSAEETAREVAETLSRKSVENDPARHGETRFLTTGSPKEFRILGERFLQLPIRRVEQVTVRELELAVA
jgi:glutamate racemase